MATGPGWTESEAPRMLAVVPSNQTSGVDPHVVLLHEMAGRMAMDTPLDKVLADVVEFVTSVVKGDSCLFYVVEQDHLVLRASRNPHPRSEEHTSELQS